MIGESDCELLSGGLLAQPINSWTSVAYIAVGVWILGRRVRLYRGLKTTYGLLVVALGVGSIAFHGPQPAGARWLHDLTIVSVVSFVVVYCLVSARRDLTRYLAIGGLLLCATVLNVLGRTGGPLCDPDSPLQLHGLWHVATATALGAWSLIAHPADTASVRPSAWQAKRRGSGP